MDVTNNRICRLQLAAYNVANNYLYGVACGDLDCSDVTAMWARRLATANPDCDDSDRVLVSTGYEPVDYTAPGVATINCSTTVVDITTGSDCSSTTFTTLL